MPLLRWSPRGLILVSLLILVGTLGCPAPEVGGRCRAPSTCAPCSSDLDCPGNELCTDGECFQGPSQPNPESREPDVPVQDGGQSALDAGEITGDDSGVDGADAGDVDSGGTSDGGASLLPDSGSLGCDCPDDGLFCNGVEACGPDGTCTSLDDTRPCGTDAPFCDEAADACVACQSDVDCDDGAYCNGAETCAAGQCAAGTPPCGAENCLESTNTCGACVDADACDDGQQCNGTERCDDGVCIPGTPLCLGGEFCVESTARCVECNVAADCSDGLFCNGVESCLNGICATGGQPCGTGACAEETNQCVQCVVDNDCGASAPYCVDNLCRECRDNGNCSDGLFCNGEETCSAAMTCVAGTAPCDASGESLLCDDTLDACVQCLSPSDCADANFCNGTERCIDGQCAPGNDPCPNGECLEDVDQCVECLNDNGCTNGEVCVDNACVQCRGAAQCDDGLACNGAEVCQGTVCVAGTPMCPAGVCSEALGCVECVSNNQCGNDGAFCNGFESCNTSIGECVSSGSPCTDPESPVCDEGQNVCVECLVDANCGDLLVCRQSQCVARTEQICSDGADNDLDGRTDCNDSDCDGRSCGSGGRICRNAGASGAGCFVPTETFCLLNSGDEDGDGLANCADPDCLDLVCELGDGTFCPPGEICVGSERRCSFGGACLASGGPIK